MGLFRSEHQHPQTPAVVLIPCPSQLHEIAAETELPEVADRLVRSASDLQDPDAGTPLARVPLAPPAPGRAPLFCRAFAAQGRGAVWGASGAYVSPMISGTCNYCLPLAPLLAPSCCCLHCRAVVCTVVLSLALSCCCLHYRAVACTVVLLFALSCCCLLYRVVACVVVPLPYLWDFRSGRPSGGPQL